MCDFHSICVRADGAVAHVPSNSHSEAVRHAKWRENEPNREPFFVEAEGTTSAPAIRGKANEKQQKVIATHYENLGKLLSDPATHAERMLFGRGFFAAPRYADIRWRVLIDARCPTKVADKLVTTALHSNGKTIKSFDPRIEFLDGVLKIADGCEIVAHSLKKVGGDVAVYGSASFPVLAEVGGDVVVCGSASFPVLAEVGGNVAVGGSAKAEFPVLAEVGGNVAVGGSASFPVLAEVGGYVAVYGGAKAEFPVLKKKILQL